MKSQCESQKNADDLAANNPLVGVAIRESDRRTPCSLIGQAKRNGTSGLVLLDCSIKGNNIEAK
jgi:hypothetical protein